MTAPESRLSEWTKPHIVFAVLGYAMMIVGAWVSFDGRIAANTQAIAEERRWNDQTRTDIRDMNQKLDRLFEPKGERYE